MHTWARKICHLYSCKIITVECGGAKTFELKCSSKALRRERSGGGKWKTLEMGLFQTQLIAAAIACAIAI